MPIPTGELRQEVVSIYRNPPFWYHSAVHWIFTFVGW